MQTHERRRLLENIDILVRKPGAATSTTMVDVLNDMGALFSELLDRRIVILPTMLHPDNEAAREKFDQSVLGTNQEQPKEDTQ